MHGRVSIGTGPAELTTGLFRPAKIATGRNSRLRGLYPALLLALGAMSVPARAQEPLTLKQSVELAQKRSNQALATTAARDAARANDRAFGSRLLPQLSFTGGPQYRRSIEPVGQPDGTIRFTPLEVTTAQAGATISQRIPLTGGTLAVTSGLERVEFRGALQDLTWSSNPVTVSLQQELLRPNTLRWQSREQDLRIDAAERQYLEAREGLAIEAANAFFDLFVAKRALENATLNAAVNDTLFTLNKGRYEVGKIGENDLLQSELALLRSRSSRDNASLQYARAMAAFRLALNIPSDTAIDVTVPDAIPEFAADTAMAVQQALRNQAEIVDLELQAVQSRRRVTEARLNNGLGASLSASLGFNQSAPEAGLAYENLLQSQRFSMQVSVPLVQWGARSAAVQAARSDQKRIEAVSRTSREQIAQDAHFAALELAQARRNVAVSAKADTVAQKRFEVAYNRYVIGRIGIDNLYIAQNEKDQAVTQYLQALRNYWRAYYRLRQLTLYDFEAGVPIR